MRVKIHHPLFTGFLGVVGFLVVVTTLVTGTGLRRELVTSYQNELSRELDFASVILENLGDISPDSIVRELADLAGYRISIISQDGSVLADSEAGPAQLFSLENQIGRPEVQSALSGVTSFSEREDPVFAESLLFGAKVESIQGQRVVLRFGAPLAEIDATVGRTRRLLFAAGAVAMISALIISYFLSRTLARPLVDLVDRAKALAAGDFSKRAPRNIRVVELDELSAAFNRLSDELQVHLTELGAERDEMQALIDCMAEGVIAITDDARILRANRAANRLFQLPDVLLYAPVGTVVRQLEVRALLEGAVGEPFDAREIRMGDRYLIASARPMDRGGAVVTFLDISEIRKLEQVRRDFVANASHELKTPLTSMRGFAEALLESDPPDTLRREFLDTIRTNSLRLQKIVDDLLDLSRLESGGWTAQSEVVEVSEVALESWNEVMANVLEEPELEFSIKGAARALADRDGLGHILRNLLENAVRYTPEGGSIEIRIDEGDETVQIAVIDTGSGVPANALPRLFERFYRVDSGRARDAGGTGLGLAIVRYLVRSMGGDVWAESQLAVGTQMSFTLPAVSRISA